MNNSFEVEIHVHLHIFVVFLVEGSVRRKENPYNLKKTFDDNIGLR